MRHDLRLLLFAAATMLPLTAMAADIQQVAAKGCATECAEGCCNMSDFGSCDSGGCNPCNNGAFCNPCGNGMCDANGNCYGGNCYGANGYCDSCNGKCKGGRCNMRTTFRAFGLDWCHPCGPIGRAARWNVPGAKTICWCCKTKAFPDSGWAPPARIPVNNGCNNGFASWYGNSGPYTNGAPMVYQPTDTAQLGFSYSNVPTWRRDASRIPGVPIPSNYHNRACPGRPCGYPVRYSRFRVFAGPMQGATCPTCPGGFTAVPQPMPVAMVAVTNAQPQPAVRQEQSPTKATRPIAITRPQTVVANNPRPATAGKPVKTVNHTVPKPQQARPTMIRTAPRQQMNSVSKRPIGNSRAASRRMPKTSSNGQRSQKSGGGWFGLPSLSEVKF